MAQKLETAPDWLRLQRKIFSRWVNQKVGARRLSCKDVVDEIKDGLLLIQLIEILSEKPYSGGKMDPAPKGRIQRLDNLNNALKFTWACGVELKIKPSPDNLVDGDEKSILGLVWAIMSKYIKIGDDEDGPQLSAKDALLIWCQQKTQGYEGVKIEKFGKDFHDGLALLAIIHKHRPKMVKWDSLSKSNGKENISLAFDVANKYFDLEKYLTPDEFLKLDENSMVIYVSEYYYGIAEQRKLDLAAKRIGKVIKLTKEHDAMKKSYVETAEGLKQSMKKK